MNAAARRRRKTIAPIALLVDVFSGFMPPRQNGYTTNKFRVWSNRRYEASDFWTHSVFDLLYQGYADCGSLHTEQTGQQR
jgi:hypothetical protein